jgi:hypothetical protein
MPLDAASVTLERRAGDGGADFFALPSDFCLRKASNWQADQTLHHLPYEVA